jgi:hypothetical protein
MITITRPYAVFQNVLAINVASRVLVSVSFLGSSLKVDAKPQQPRQSKEIQLALQSVYKMLTFVIIHDFALEWPLRRILRVFETSL